MKPSEIRKKLHKYLDEADNDSLNFISEAVAVYKAKKGKGNKKPEDMSYPWAPTDEELFAQIERSEENLKNGNYYTHEEVVAMRKTWHTKV